MTTSMRENLRDTIRRFGKRLETLPPTPENLRKVAEARAKSPDVRMKYKEILDMTAEYLLIETDGPEEPGRGVRAAIYFEAGNKDVPKNVAADIVVNREKRTASSPESEQSGYALLEAVENGDMPKIVRLVAGGADLSVRNDNGFAALHIAVERCVPAVFLLLLAGADPNAEQKGLGWTPFMLMIQRYPRLADLFITFGADVNKPRGDGSTPLNISAGGAGFSPPKESVRKESARVLIAAGADIDRPDSDGKTPLMSAAPWYPELVRYLIEAGADPAARDDEGYTVGDYCVGSGIFQCLRVWAEYVDEQLVADALENNEDYGPAAALTLLSSDNLSFSEEVLEKMEEVFLRNVSGAAFVGLRNLQDEADRPRSGFSRGFSFRRFLDTASRTGERVDILRSNMSEQVNFLFDGARTFVVLALKLLNEDPDSLTTVKTFVENNLTDSLKNLAAGNPETSRLAKELTERIEFLSGISSGIPEDTLRV